MTQERPDAIEAPASLLRRQLAALGDASVNSHERADAAGSDREFRSPDLNVNPDALAAVDRLLARVDRRAAPIDVAGAASVRTPCRSDEGRTQAVIAFADGSSIAITPGEEVVVGRREGVGRKALAIPELSKGHVRLWFDTALWIDDLASTNGTVVERGTTRIGVDPGAPMQLEAGDRVMVGSVCIAEVSERESSR